MTDTRQVLEEAFKAIYPEPSREWETWDGARIAEQREEDKASFMRWNDWRICKKARFRRFLDAEAWTDAALCLVPEGWRPYLAAIDVKEWVANLTCDHSDDTFAKGHGLIPALALAQAALRAKEAGDV